MSIPAASHPWNPSNSHGGLLGPPGVPLLALLGVSGAAGRWKLQPDLTSPAPPALAVLQDPTLEEQKPPSPQEPPGDPPKYPIPAALPPRPSKASYPLHRPRRTPSGLVCIKPARTWSP
ncbi:hypothetical protein TgHK011_009518 [Trichoderma gracile]|nr:hypothetical protein TgHK011_009518 [Trichoderma gracile]